MSSQLSRDPGEAALQVPRLIGAPDADVTTNFQNTTGAEQAYILANGSGSTAYFRIDSAITAAANTDNYLWDKDRISIIVPNLFYINVSGTIRVSKHDNANGT